MLGCVYQAQRIYPYNETGAIIRKKTQLYLVWLGIAFFVFSFVFGIRYDVGVDHIKYVDIYLYGYEFEQNELLYVIWNNAFSLLKMPYPIFFATISFFLISTFFLAFKKESKLYVFFVLFLFFDGQVNSWNNVIRVSISCCIWIFSINYIARKKIIHFMACCILAVGFHTSSIVLFLGYPLLVSGKNYFKRIPVQLSLVAVAFIVRYLFSSVLEPIMQMMELYVGLISKYEYYTNSVNSFEQVESSGTNLAFYARIIVNIFIILNSPNLHKFYNDRKFNIIYNIYFVGLLINYAMPAGFVALSRPFVFFWIFGTIVLAYYAYYLKSTQKSGALILILVLYIGLYYGSLIRGVPNTNAHVKYQTYFDHPEVSLVPKYKPHNLLEN